MLVTASVDCFVGGAFRKRGTTFQYDGKANKYLVTQSVKTAPAVEVEQEELTKEDIRAKLAQYGIKVAPQTSREKMLEKLAEAEDTTPVDDLPEVI